MLVLVEGVNIEFHTMLDQEQEATDAEPRSLRATHPLVHGAAQTVGTHMVIAVQPEPPAGR